MCESRVQGRVRGSYVSYLIMNYSTLFLIESSATLLLDSSAGLSRKFSSVVLYSVFSIFTHYASYYLVRRVLGIYAYRTYNDLYGLLWICVLYGEFFLNVSAWGFFSTTRVQSTCCGLSIRASQARSDEIGCVRAIYNYRSSGTLVSAGTVRLSGRLIRYLLALIISTTRSYTATSNCYVGLVSGCSAEHVFLNVLGRVSRS